MSTTLFDVYLLDGEAGTSIKLFEVFSTSALEAADWAREQFKDIGTLLEGKTCMEVVPHDKEPMDVLAWKKRHTTFDANHEGGFKSTLLYHWQVGYLMKALWLREQEKVEEIQKEQEFGLVDCASEEGKTVHIQLRPDKPMTLETVLNKIDDEEG